MKTRKRRKGSSRRIRLARKKAALARIDRVLFKAIKEAQAKTGQPFVGHDRKVKKLNDRRYNIIGGFG